MTPQRIQLSRRRGWRKPAGAVVVSRPTKWGNPYKPTDYKFAHADGSPAPFNAHEARAMAIRDFAHALHAGLLRFTCADVRRELGGKSLACWCRLGLACHADVLLETANDPPHLDPHVTASGGSAGTPEDRPPQPPAQQPESRLPPDDSA